MKAIRININDYEYAGQGANGQSFNHRTDPGVMLKLYNSSAPYVIIENELECAHKAYGLGIPTPKPGDFVTDGNGRFGIRFERIPDKISYSRAVGDNPQNVEYYARRFADLCLQLHSIHLERGTFTDIKEFNRNILSNSTIYTATERSVLERYINGAPDGDTAIHGDLQFSNAIITGGRSYLIDLGDFACGSPLFDLGMVLFTCCYDNVDFLRNEYHMEPETAAMFWHYFVKQYFGEDADPHQKESELRPYAALKLLIIERNAGVIPGYHWLIQ